MIGNRNLLCLMFIILCSLSFAKAQSPIPSQAQVTPQASPVQSSPGVTQEQTKQKTPECACAKPARDTLQVAYTSLGEEGWDVAIRDSKQAVESIKVLSKTCKCTEVADYQNSANAFLKYAEGGDHLDRADNPNCSYALKLYDEAISLLKDSIPKITNAEVKANAKSILEGTKEEREFVEDECRDIEQTTKPESKAPAQPKK